MPPALDLNPPASFAAAPWGLGPPSGLHFPMGADQPKEGEKHMIHKKKENGENVCHGHERRRNFTRR